MKFMIKYKSKDGTTMTLTDYGFAPDMFFAPKLCTFEEANVISNAIDSILMLETDLGRYGVNRLCFYQEAV